MVSILSTKKCFCSRLYSKYCILLKKPLFFTSYPVFWSTLATSPKKNWKLKRYYKVYNPISAISNVDDYSQSARLLAATTLRNVLGTKNLGDILSDREQIAGMMQSTLDEATDPWGVKVERVEV